MHTIEPYYRWRSKYISSEDMLSPFYGRIYSEFEFSNRIYNYYIHPQWDEFGSETLYLKVLYVNYEMAFSIIEFIGEWNDTLYNDIMYLKREVIDSMISEGVNKFVLIGENVFNFHASDDSYYEEWFNDIENGWICGIEFQEHVIQEFKNERINYFVSFFINLDFNWRTYTPIKLFETINNLFLKRLEI